MDIEYFFTKLKSINGDFVESEHIEGNNGIIPHVLMACYTLHIVNLIIGKNVTLAEKNLVFLSDAFKVGDSQVVDVISVSCLEILADKSELHDVIVPLLDEGLKIQFMKFL